MGKINDKYVEQHKFILLCSVQNDIKIRPEFNPLIYISGCWEQDPHKRPSFKEILQELDVIACSGFGETPNESFHTMQDGWRKEINEVLFELRKKEKVSKTPHQL